MRKRLMLVSILMVSLQTFAARVPFQVNVRNFTGGASRAYVQLVLMNCTDASGNAIPARAAGYTPAETVKPTQTFTADATGKVAVSIVPTQDLTCGITTGQSRYQVEVWEGAPTDPQCTAGQTSGCRKRLFADQYQIAAAFDLATASPYNGTSTAVVPNAVLTNPAGSQTIAQPVGSTLAVVGGTIDLSGTTCIGCGTGGPGGSTTLKTNGVNNSSQTTLNLQNGASTTASNPSGGNVQVDVIYGTSSNTAAQGNDSRITGAAQKASNLSDLASASSARGNLGLGTAAVLDVPAAGDAAGGQVVKGSDTRLTDARTPTTHTHPASDIASGTLAAARLPVPGVSSIGAVQAKTCSSTDKISAIGTDGIPVCSADQTGAAGGGITTLNGSTQATQSFVDGTGVHVSTNTGTGAHTIGLTFSFTTETPSGSVNGANATFTLANTPIAGSLNLFINGFRLTQGSGYTLSGSTITYQAGYIPNSGDTHEASYRY